MRVLAGRAVLREDVARLLDELGGTPSEVAASLSYYMGTGFCRPYRRQDDPLARYLHAVIGADTRVREVRVLKRWVALSTRPGWGAVIWLRLPAPVRRFSIVFVRPVPRQRPMSL